MKSHYFFATTSIGLLFIVFSCTHAIKTKTNSSTANLTSQSDSTQNMLSGDTILAPLKYKIEEMRDFPIGQGMPFILIKDSFFDKKYLHFVDGAMVEEAKKEKVFKKLQKKGIESVELIPAAEAIELYGQKAQHGAVIIQTKKGE